MKKSEEKLEARFVVILLFMILFLSDYSKGFGGKFGVQKDRVDKSAVGWDHQEKLEKHESQKGKICLPEFDCLMDDKVLALTKLKNKCKHQLRCKNVKFGLSSVKTLWEKEKMFLQAFYRFPTMFSKAFHLTFVRSRLFFCKGTL